MSSGLSDHVDDVVGRGEGEGTRLEMVYRREGDKIDNRGRGASLGLG